MLKSDNIVSHRQYQIARGLSWIMIFILIIRYFQIQIVEHEIYRHKSNTNRIRKVAKNAPRGLILDRFGEILVDNYPVYVLTAIPGEMNDKNNQFKLIAEYIESDSASIGSNYKKYYRGRFVPTRLAKDMNFIQLGNLEENKLNLEGVYYDQIPERFYPNGVRAPHLFGYVKEIDRSIRKTLKNRNFIEAIKGFQGIIDYMQVQTTEEESKKQMKILNRHLDEWDSSANLNWKKSVPHLQELISGIDNK